MEALPLPLIGEDARWYWEGARQGQLLIQHCLDCGLAQFYPREICRACHSRRLEPRPSTGRGTIYSYTIVYRAPIPALRPRVPYVIALVDLEEGVRVMSNVLCTAPDQIRIGQKVHMRIERRGPDDLALPQFEPEA